MKDTEMAQANTSAENVGDLGGADSGLPKVQRRKEDEGKELPEGVQVLEPGYDARDDLSTLRVLIVDDNRFHRSLVRNAMISQSIQGIWEAEDADEAEKIMADQPIDLIVLDNNMPGEKGITFTQRLRQGKVIGNRCTPIIMVTAYGDEKIITAARNAGVHEYILKPFNVVTLIKRVQLTFKTPRDFIISPGYVGPDRRWEQKLKAQQANGNESPDNDDAKSNTGGGQPGISKPEVLIFD
ncbi:MAG: response regulator [Rhodospirillales bacterium]|nr:response regulator [Rhodospirillales bacterium]